LTVSEDHRVFALNGSGYHLRHRNEDLLVAGVFSKDVAELVLVLHIVLVDSYDLALVPLVASITSCRLMLLSISHWTDSE
jgi:hypothetical protein